jgi:hypothetical protein
MKTISMVKGTNEMSNRQIGKGKGIPFAIFAILLLLGMIVTIVGCSKRSSLVGIWAEYIDEDGDPSGDVLEFFSDGTVAVDSDGEVNGEWKIEKGQIMVSTHYDSFTAKISGSTLTLIDNYGNEIETLKKVKK